MMQFFKNGCFGWLLFFLERTPKRSAPIKVYHTEPYYLRPYLPPPYVREYILADSPSSPRSVTYIDHL